jgi:hypothetical protein
LIARIVELEETLAGYKKDLERLEKGAWQQALFML